MNNTGIKYVLIMKQTAFRRGKKNGDYIPRLNIRHHHYHHHMFVMELGHLLIRSV